jgi:hypothetical protein
MRIKIDHMKERMVTGRSSPPHHERLQRSKMLILQNDVPSEHNSQIVLRDALLHIYLQKLTVLETSFNKSDVMYFFRNTNVTLTFIGVEVIALLVGGWGERQ